VVVLGLVKRQVVLVAVVLVVVFLVALGRVEHLARTELTQEQLVVVALMVVQDQTD
jgi:hypothetical protein